MAPVWVVVPGVRRVLATSLLVATAAGCLFQDTAGPLVFDPAELPQARLGTAYEAQITIRDNVTDVLAFNVRAGTLPPGLRLETAPPLETGIIRGVPEAAARA